MTKTVYRTESRKRAYRYSTSFMMKTSRLSLKVRQIVKMSDKANLHIEVADDDFAEDADKQPEVELVVSLDFVGIKSSEPIAVGEAVDDKVDKIAGKKCLFYRANGRIPIDFTQLGHDKVSVNNHVANQA